MKSNLDKMYENLLDMENDSRTFGDLDDMLMGDGKAYDPDDVETFVTSKELIKTKQKLEEYSDGIGEPEKHEIEETAHFKLYGKKRKHKYTEKEMEAIRESCVHTIVHDYSEKDFYHMTDEERAETDMLSELRVKVGSLRRSYGKVDQYIEAMRIVVQAWEMLEEKGNFIHSTDEFFQMVADGRITSNSIIMPKLKKMDRYNIDTLIKYISNPELDPKDLTPNTDNDDEVEYDLNEIFVDLDQIRKDPKIDEYYYEFLDKYRQEHDMSEDEELDEYEIQDEAVAYIREQFELDKMERLLSPEQVEYIMEFADDPEEIKVHEFKRSWIKNYDRKFIPSKFKGKKKDKLLVQNIHEMLNKIQSDPKNNADDVSKSYSITNNMFDTDSHKDNFWDKLFFDGSWASESDTYIYDLAIVEELLKLNPPGESYVTYADKQQNAFFKILEDNGVSTVELRRKMGCSKDQLNKAESRRTKKQNAKIEAAIIQRIEKLNDSPKFKKLISKAEKKLNDFNQD